MPDLLLTKIFALHVHTPYQESFSFISINTQKRTMIPLMQMIYYDKECFENTHIFLERTKK